MLPDNLSWYWIGSLNLPQDEAELQSFTDLAIRHGINVFEADPRLAAALRNYPRSSYHLFSECDLYELSIGESVADRVEADLAACSEDYIDFYYLSYLNEATTDPAYDEAGRIASLLSLRQSGKIHLAGVFYSGMADGFYDFRQRFLEEMDFYAFRINYFDWFAFESISMAGLARISGVPVIALEPTKSGLLENVSSETLSAMHARRPDDSPLDWCINWLRSGNKVSGTVIQPSGIRDLERYLASYDNGKMLDAEEDCFTLAVSDEIKDYANAEYWQCINCMHCAEACPLRLDIGLLMTYYKNLKLQWDDKLVRQYRSLPENLRASQCIRCGGCIRLCQQKLSIPQYLTDLEKIAADI